MTLDFTITVPKDIVFIPPSQAGSTTLPSAYTLYPSDFNFKLNTDQLKQVASRPLYQTSFLLDHLWKPTTYAIFYAARVVEPLSGQNKDALFYGVAVRAYSLILASLCLAAAIPTWLVLFPWQIHTHLQRSCIQYKQPLEPVPPPPGPLHIRTHNIAQGPESFVALTDLRPNRERAQELVSSLLQDPQAPHFLVFQEAYNQIEILSKLQEKYPYIAHSIAPDACGLSSGFFVASQYPIQQMEFRRLEMQGPEKFICRGALKVRIKTADQRELDIYAVHLQALLGKKRADQRLQQLQLLKEWMASDYRKEKVPQLLVGDFNTSHVTAWGEENDHPAQPEQKVLQYLQSHFFDCYAEQHNPRMGERIAGQPHFLAHDNQRMHTNLSEPSGSWYHGPFADKGLSLRLKMWWDQVMHRYPTPRIVKPIENPTAWGTPRWHQNQTANTARFDYVVIPQECRSRFESIVTEIRRIPIPSTRQSASSDHLPVDYVFRLSR